jgi:hypothetical protein
MKPITARLDAVLVKYETEVRPAVILFVPDGYGLDLSDLSSFVMRLQLPRRPRRRQIGF